MTSEQQTVQSALQMAMEAGSWFDRKDLTLDQREQRVGILIQARDAAIRQEARREALDEACKVVCRSCRLNQAIRADGRHQAESTDWTCYAAAIRRLA